MSPRALAIALALSLALNLFLVGFVSSRMLGGEPGVAVEPAAAPGPERKGPKSGARKAAGADVGRMLHAARNLGFGEQAETVVRSHRRTMREERRALRDARRAVEDALIAETFDRKALGDALKQQRAAHHRAQGSAHVALIELSGTLDRAQRKSLLQATRKRRRARVDRMDQRHRRGAERERDERRERRERRKQGAERTGSPSTSAP